MLAASGLVQTFTGYEIGYRFTFSKYNQSIGFYVYIVDKTKQRENQSGFTNTFSVQPQNRVQLLQKMQLTHNLIVTNIISTTMLA